MVDPVVARSPIELAVDATLKSRLFGLAAGRPLVIDFYTSRHGAITVGDITVCFGIGPLEPRYVELEPLEGVQVLAELHLVPLIADGATLRLAWFPFARHLDLSLSHPERWIEFLERQPTRRW